MLDIRTARLRIRMMRESDAEIVVAYRNDPEIAALQDWELPYLLERARASDATMTFATRCCAPIGPHG